MAGAVSIGAMISLAVDLLAHMDNTKRHVLFLVSLLHCDMALELGYWKRDIKRLSTACIRVRERYI